MFAVSLFAVPATANAATGGGLKQLASGDGCITGEDPAPSGCRTARALAGIGDVIVSPGGSAVYASSPSRDAIVVFTRNTTTGVLTQKTGPLGCITSNATTASNFNCNLIPDVRALNGVGPLAISPDGTDVYSVNSGADGDVGDNGIISTSTGKATAR